MTRNPESAKLYRMEAICWSNPFKMPSTTLSRYNKGTAVLKIESDVPLLRFDKRCGQNHLQIQ